MTQYQEYDLPVRYEWVAHKVSNTHSLCYRRVKGRRAFSHGIYPTDKIDEIKKMVNLSSSFIVHDKFGHLKPKLVSEKINPEIIYQRLSKFVPSEFGEIPSSEYYFVYNQQASMWWFDEKFKSLSELVEVYQYHMENNMDSKLSMVSKIDTRVRYETSQSLARKIVFQLTDDDQIVKFLNKRWVDVYQMWKICGLEAQYGKLPVD